MKKFLKHTFYGIVIVLGAVFLVPPMKAPGKNSQSAKPTPIDVS